MVFRSQLELADRFVDETHLLVRDAEVVVRVVVFAVELLFDALLEFLEDLFERLLVFRKRNLLASFGNEF